MEGTSPVVPSAADQSLLFWRKSLFDPDRLFARLVPRIGFLWTRGFLVLSAAGILAAAAVAATNSGSLASRFADALSWQTVALVWLTLLVATTLHEFAHGLTCRHFGGEVHEVGFLAMFFVPCLYCNVSDAWLIPERRKRLLITLAGGYCDLCLWAAAVFVWRLSPPETLTNYIAWVVFSVLGVRVVFNFNPLLKLDGYYLLVDLTGVSNLQQRGLDRAKAHVRRVLWGAEPPPPDRDGRLLTSYGLASGAFSLVFLGLMLAALFRFLWAEWGALALAVIPLGYVTGRGLVAGLTGGEVAAMVRRRQLRAAAWTAALLAAAVASVLVQVEDRSGGQFQVRAAARSEVRAPAAGFLRDVCCDEGDPVAPGAVVARLEVPDLVSRVTQKTAEVREGEAKLRLLEAGARREEVEESRQRVKRAGAGRDRARTDLDRSRTALAEDLARLAELVTQHEAEARFATENHTRVRQLRDQGAGSLEQSLDAARLAEVARSQLEQARAQRRSIEATGAREAEAELARRTKELADAEGTLTLLEAPPRVQEVDAARAHLTRLQEELRYLDGIRGKLVVTCPVGGVVTTPRTRERAGQYLKEGDLILVVEDPASLEVEVALSEPDAGRVRPGQRVELKARGLPFDTIRGQVARVAPAVARPDSGPVPATPSPGPGGPGTVMVYCRLDGGAAELRPGMTGYARVYAGQRPVSGLALDRLRKVVRTEFWW